MIVTENWIKPPHLVTYTNAEFISEDDEGLICEFQFPDKYSKHDFFLDNQKVLNAGEMFFGKRFFYHRRFYSLLEFYDYKRNLTARYIDVTLPAHIESHKVFIIDLKVDFFVLEKTGQHFVLDEDEFADAVTSGLFSSTEIEAGKRTTSHIKSLLLNNDLSHLFSDYETGSWLDWPRYSKYL